MEKKQLWFSAGVVILALAAIGGFFFYASQYAAHNSPKVEENQTLAVSLTIQGLYEKSVHPVSAGTTLLSFLQSVNAEDPKMHMETKEYSGLGTLVTAFASMQNGTDNKYWQYKVNGEMPQIGADTYVLKNGDAVEWYFAPSQE